VAAPDRPLVGGVVAPNRSLKAQAFEAIRTAIVEGRLDSSQLYSVETISREMSISRTPVREALLDLAGRGMVRFERNQGFRVLQMTIEDLRDILTLRLLAEVPGAYRATLRITPAGLDELDAQNAAMDKLQRKGDVRRILDLDREFHRTILQTSGNLRLCEHVEHLRDLMTLRGYYSTDAQHDLHEHLEQHHDIVDAMRRADPAGAASAMKMHVIDTGRDLLRHAGDVDGNLEWADMVVIPPNP
jgi:DNA-binding GntR family transcriptional regulator